MHTTIKTLLATTAMMFAVGAIAQTATNNNTPVDPSTDTMQAPDAQAKPARSTGRYVDDKTISAKINAIFLADSGLKSGGIKVATYKGVVHLTGSAISQDQIELAVHKARSVTGVKSVTNDLEVTPAT